MIKNSLKAFVFGCALAIGSVAGPAQAADGDLTYTKIVRIGGTPRAPYWTYNVYTCFYATGECQLMYTMIGINPEL